ncbi:helix-turn-helix domain-containing protein [Mycobacterium sp. E787]|uniref:MarR family transcriptional regulator n=1 Tax=Mycobacterium sp. E787 TaxID=1834150 RepID=UPI000800DC04|nr:helix-turn-helix domain-containing protein [Mycobacterium sp. E787]OBI52873.1 hypothetical protein A5705_04875 [Mycobacterium sp. E787]
MDDAAFGRLIGALEAHGCHVKINGNRAIAQCPCPGHGDGHGDRNPSLSITGIEGQVLIHCHAGCSPQDVMAALNKTMADLFNTRNGATYTYGDGRKVHRKPNKTFRQSGNTEGNALFHGDRIGDAATVYVVEGEKDVLAIEAAGGAAVTSAMGACKARLADWSPLEGKHATIVADNDKAGRNHAAQVAGLLEGIAASVRIVEAVEGKDAADHIAAGHTLDEFVPFTPQKTTATAQPPRWEAVQPIAQLRRILDAVADEVRSRGLVGEERLAKILYLVLTSRLLDKQVSAGVKGHSASGKSYTVETVTRFFPPEAYLEFTAMSEKALIYSNQQYAHRTIVIYEVTALREGVEDDMTSYFIRSLLSEGRIDYEVTIRDKDGGFTTKTITKTGPTNLIFTTTKTRVHAENETRIFSLATDDSRAQTARVLLEIADETNGGNDLEQWRGFQRWLAGAEHRVTIPYARRLAEQVPPAAVRLRRDFGSLLALIRAHAVLHQASRDRDEDGRIIAALDDYAVVRDLVADIISEGVGATVSDTVRDTVEAVAALASDLGVMVTAIADKLGLDKSNASRRLRVAADGGYVRNLEDKRGKPGRWVVGDDLPEAVELLPEPSQLATADTMPDQSGCAVAHESGGESDAVVHCLNCGDEIPLHMPLARARGYCSKGRCIVAANEKKARS